MEKFMSYDDFKEQKEELKGFFDDFYTEENYKQMVKVNELAKIQKEKLNDFAKHYFDCESITNEVDIRLAYYQIIDDCLKELKHSDKNLHDNIKFCCCEVRKED